ncbi:MAG: VPLPA-CTERM sorting domain-containing protein [Methylomonas lenta]|jgi:hypothetical protein|nr:VPLPA-CTERM sorting domain-containing protein [Methylomonas lenta]
MGKAFKSNLALVYSVMALLLCSTQASASLTNVVKFSQGENIAVVSGGMLTVDVVGDNFTVGPDGAGFSLNWDPTVLQHVSTSFVNPPWNISSADETTASSGLIDSIFVGITTLNTNAGSSFGIASFTFNVLGNPGDVTALAIGNDSFSIGFLNGVTGLNVNYLDSQVQVVPLPAAVWMFGVGFVGMLGSMKRRKAA